MLTSEEQFAVDIKDSKAETKINEWSRKYKELL